MSSPASSEENIGLFLLRKDSERRATLHSVLTDYISYVVTYLQESIQQVCGAKFRQKIKMFTDEVDIKCMHNNFYCDVYPMQHVS